MYILDHKTHARLHNILADAYNHQTRKWSKPDANEIMALMSVLAKLRISNRIDGYPKYVMEDIHHAIDFIQYNMRELEIISSNGD